MCPAQPRGQVSVRHPDGEYRVLLAQALTAADALAVHCADVLSNEELQRAGKEADEREHPLQMDAYRAVNQKAASLPDR